MVTVPLPLSIFKSLAAPAAEFTVELKFIAAPVLSLLESVSRVVSAANVRAAPIVSTSWDVCIVPAVVTEEGAVATMPPLNVKTSSVASPRVNDPVLMNVVCVVMLAFSLISISYPCAWVVKVGVVKSPLNIISSPLSVSVRTTDVTVFTTPSKVTPPDAVTVNVSIRVTSPSNSVLAVPELTVKFSVPPAPVTSSPKVITESVVVKTEVPVPTLKTPVYVCNPVVVISSLVEVVTPVTTKEAALTISASWVKVVTLTDPAPAVRVCPFISKVPIVAAAPMFSSFVKFPISFKLPGPSKLAL